MSIPQQQVGVALSYDEADAENQSAARNISEMEELHFL